MHSFPYPKEAPPCSLSRQVTNSLLLCTSISFRTPLRQHFVLREWFSVLDHRVLFSALFGYSAICFPLVLFVLRATKLGVSATFWLILWRFFFITWFIYWQVIFVINFFNFLKNFLRRNLKLSVGAYVFMSSLVASDPIRTISILLITWMLSHPPSL